MQFGFILAQNQLIWPNDKKTQLVWLINLTLIEALHLIIIGKSPFLSCQNVAT